MGQKVQVRLPVAETDTYVVGSLVKTLFPHAFHGVGTIQFYRAQVELTNVGKLPLTQVKIIFQLGLIVVVFDLLAGAVQVTRADATG